jgi:hypothetical protein
VTFAVAASLFPRQAGRGALRAGHEQDFPGKNPPEPVSDASVLVSLFLVCRCGVDLVNKHGPPRFTAATNPFGIRFYAAIAQPLRLSPTQRKKRPL